ncbi:MAG: F0F1 ATP synthase subunit A [Xanthomonadaceae bacterium]|jgi:F-type H+-transporting ATPase subunit a|nr:F0F1 ATP synthase subunit A [Xanthomonadaceae bacterium]
MASSELTPTGYIQHHLTNLKLQVGEGGFWVLHLDTLITSVFVGLFMCFAFWLATRRATAGVPGRWQAFVEMVLEFVDQQCKDSYQGTSRLVTPIAITLFCWILLLNAFKFIPADFLAIPLGMAAVALAELFGAADPSKFNYWKPVPTTDMSATLGMSFSVFFLMIFFALRAKGFGGFIHELFTAPFGKWLFPANLLLNFVELLSKPISLAMRLFGNMYGGELVFLLIWVLGSAGIAGMLAGGTFGLGWMLFHLLVVPLQAFIFMMLSIVYLGLMEEHH